MKLNITKYSRIVLAAGAALSLTACNDYLDIEPESAIAPETYFTQADQLGAYTIAYYADFSYYNEDCGGQFPVLGGHSSGAGCLLQDDQGTDNERGSSHRFAPDYQTSYRVGSGGGKWNFDRITKINWFLNTVRPRLKAGEISGSEVAAKHYLGEGYFLRAMEYFFRMRRLGDFPIITVNLPDDRAVLNASSKRMPRNKVARFILSDLDTALTLLSDGSQTGGKNRITRDAALLLKARVALFEATWEKNFAGTPFVPDAAAGWPGKDMEYNKDFTYDNQTEVNFFIDQALAAASELADKRTLANNSKNAFGEEPFDTQPKNDYYDMFSSVDPSAIDEVILMRSYSISAGAGSNLNKYLRSGNDGYTQEFANAFLMENGLPIYDANSGYAGDDHIGDTKTGRDWRWRLFMKAPGEYVYVNSEERVGAEGKKIPNDEQKRNYIVPNITKTGSFGCGGGYFKGKGMCTNDAYTVDGQDETALVIYRAAEAYLIYLEAAWYKYGDALDSKAWDYWKKLRERAGVADPQITIAATDLDKEYALTQDLGMYTAGQKITSKVLYNIRRERRCELMSEGMRFDDLMRWRSMDQLIGGKYFLHGCKIHGPMFDEFKKGRLKYGQANPDDNNISDPNDMEGALNGDPRYISFYRVSNKSTWYNTGMQWRMAHYLDPIANSHFLESSADGHDISTSLIYQNPYWLTETDSYSQK